MRSRIIRRSVSNFVSPGPLVPIPPPKRERDIPCPIIRGSVYCSCASSTCSLPSFVRARCAKISRINAVRSSTLIPSACSRFRCWAGDNSSSNTQRSTSSCCANRARSLTLPRPIKNPGSGLGRFCKNFAITSAPAVSASCRSSSSESSLVHSRSCFPYSKLTSMVRSGRCSSLWLSSVAASRFSAELIILGRNNVSSASNRKTPYSSAVYCP